MPVIREMRHELIEDSRFFRVLAQVGETRRSPRRAVRHLTVERSIERFPGSPRAWRRPEARCVMQAPRSIGPQQQGARRVRNLVALEAENPEGGEKANGPHQRL